jgi:hypothetical protein
MDDMWGFYRWLPFLYFDFFYVVVGYLWEEAVGANKVREERRYEKIQPIT